MEVKQEQREERFEVKIKTEPSQENCYNQETYYVNNCDSFKIKQEVLKIEDEEVFDLNSEPSNSSNDINIKLEKVEHEEQFQICDEIETETHNDELYSKDLNTDEKLEIFDEFCKHKDFKEEVDSFQSNKTTFESINKMEKNDMETDIQSDVSIDNNLSTNEQQYSNEQIKLQCEFCDKSFAKKVSMDDHLLKHHPEISKSKLISLTKTTHKNSLHSHKITHNDQLITKCKFCEEEFVKKVSMEDHLLNHHTNLSETDFKGLITSKVFTCEICMYKTTHKHSLYSHYNIKHSKICSYSTTHIHNIPHSEQQLKIKCKFCDEEFVKKVSIEDHYLKHHTELSKTDLKGLITSKVWRCKLCPYKTTHKNCLDSHINTKHGKRHQLKCNFCDELFVKKASMVNHILKHHLELANKELIEEQMK